MFWRNYLLLCDSIGKSPGVVAVELGFSNSTATSWKKGAIPRNFAIKKIADYFGVTVDYLLQDDENAAKEGGVGISDSALEAARLFDRAEPWVRDQVLSLLRAAESAHEARGAGPKGP